MSAFRRIWWLVKQARPMVVLLVVIFGALLVQVITFFRLLNY